jgi:hypothetical protein
MNEDFLFIARCLLIFLIINLILVYILSQVDYPYLNQVVVLNNTNNPFHII